MDHVNGRHARLRHIAMGALAALLAVGAVAGTTALAAKPHRHATRHHATHRRAKVVKGGATKTPTSAPQPPASPQPFLNAVERLVHNGTITAQQGQAIDRQIRRGYIDPSTLTGFTPAQIQAVQQALANAKRAL